MIKKVIIITFVLIAATLINVTPFSFSMDEPIPQKRPERDKYCFDFVGVLPQKLVREINTQGYGLKGAYDIDFVVVIIPSLGKFTSFKDKFPWKRKEGDSWMGLYLGYSQPYERDVIESYVSVLYVVENSPAEKAGFKDGDLVYYLPEMKNQYATSADYISLLKNTKPGDTVKFKVLRNLKEKVELTLEMGSYSPGKEGL